MNGSLLKPKHLDRKEMYTLSDFLNKALFIDTVYTRQRLSHLKCQDVSLQRNTKVETGRLKTLTVHKLTCSIKVDVISIKA